MAAHRSKLLRSLALLWFFTGLFSLGGAVGLTLIAIFLLKNWSGLEAIIYSSFIGAFMILIVAVVKLVVGIGLWHHRHWSWWIALGAAIFGVIVGGSALAKDVNFFHSTTLLIDTVLLWIVLRPRTRREIFTTVSK